MGRKNKRKKTDYPDGLGFNAWKYIRPRFGASRATGAYTHLGASTVPTTGGRTMSEMKSPQRGDIWFAALDSHAGTSIQGGCRPVLVVSNNIGNTHAETLNVLPMTRHLKKPNLPCHTELDPDAISDKRQTMDYSMILAEQITTIGKDQLRNYVGHIQDDALLSAINRAIAMQLGLAPVVRQNEYGGNYSNEHHYERRSFEKGAING